MILDTEAVVLRTLNHGDTSKIITLYSRDTGRLKLIAKGVRSAKSKALGLFQPTHHLSVSYYEKQQSELQLFKSGELIRGFFQLEKDFDRLTLAQVLVELVERSAEKEEPHPKLFDLVVESLNRLNDPEESTSLTYWYFHLQFLREMGFRPETDRCHFCGETLKHGAGLRPRVGGLTCLRCQPLDVHDIELSPQLIELLNQLLDNHYPEDASVKLSEIDRRRLWDFLWRYTHFHIEPTRNMKSLKVLKQLYG